MAARVVRDPAGGIESLPDGAVHEGTRYTCSCMTSRARSKVHGRALPCEVRELRVATLELRDKKKHLIGEQRQASLSGEQDSQVRGERPPVWGTG